MQPMHIFVLGPEGAERSALESTLCRLGCTVSAAEASTERRPLSAADVLMLDARGDESRWAGLARDLHDDERPVMLVSEGPTPAVRELARRPAGIVLLTGAESDAGYRVALSVLRGLRDGAFGHAPAARNGTLSGLAAQ